MTEIQKDNKNIANVPPLRFPGFTGEWEVTSIEKNCLLKGRIGYRGYTTGDLVEKGKGAFVLGGKHIKNQTIDLSEPTFLSWDKYYESPEIMVKVGDIIFSQRGTLGDCAIIEKEIGFATINPSMVLLKDITCNPKFLYYILIGENIQNEVQKNKALGAIPMLSQKQIKNFPFLIPKNPNEQQKISSFLSLIDERIQTQIKIIEELKLLKNTLRYQLYEQILNQENEIVQIKEVLNYEQPTKYLVSNTDYSSDNSLIPVLTANKAFVLGYTAEDFGIYDKGECIIFDDFTMNTKFVDFPFKVKSSAIKILTAKSNVNLKFMFEYLSFLGLSSNEHKRHYISEIEPIEISLPNYHQQNQIANILSKIDEKIKIESNIFTLQTKQKQYFLANIFI